MYPIQGRRNNLIRRPNMKRLNKNNTNRINNLQWLWKNFNSYCKHSSIHGLKYVMDSQQPCLDRLFWTVAFVTSLFLSIIMIHGSWIRWQEQPFVMIFDSRMTPISSIPFPTVTVCSDSPISKSRFNMNLKELKNSNINHTNWWKHRLYASLFCSADQELPASRIHYEGEVSNDFFTFLNDVSPRCEDILKVCLWQDNEVDCCKIFEPIVTNLGICYAFNMVPANILFKSLEGVRQTNLTNSKSENETFNYDDYVFWHPQEGYRVTNHSKIKYPRTVNKPGGKDGLSIELFANESEWQYECAGSHRGFWLLLTTAYELPQQDTSIAYHIAMNKFTQINAKPTTINTDLALYSLSSTERQCYFQNENQLKFYRYYTHQNCDDECRFGFLLKRCNCIPFFLPGRSSTDRICTRSDIKCISDAMRKYTHMHGKMGPGNESTRLPCFCMASCFSLSFKYDISASDFIFSNVTPPWAVNTTFNGERDNVGRVSIFSAVGSFLGVKRHKNTSIYEFIGNCGGLLGMLLGFSLISAFEVIYFLSVRPISDKIEFRKKNQMKLIIKKTPCIIYYE